MPAGYHISEDEGLISVQISEHVDLIELYDVAKSLHRDPAYNGDLPLLVDLRGMRIELVREALEPFSAYVIRHYNARAGSNAIIIDTDMDNRLSAAIYWLACAVDGTELFDDYDHGLKWLIRREFAASGTVGQR